MAVFLGRLHLFLFLCLPIFVALARDDLAKRLERARVTSREEESLVSQASLCCGECALTCVIVRRILRPLAWSSRPASWLSSSPDSCSSSGCSSTTASWFNLMSGIKDCSATPNVADKIKPVISGFLWTFSLLHFVPWAKTPGSVPEVGQYLQ